jgi:NAD(P)H-quinone oxidoreductase subunit 5
MAFMGGLSKHMQITRATFFIGTLSFCGIPLLACFWSKDEILAGSWMYF